MNAQCTIELQNRIAESLARSETGKWEILVVNFEVDVIEGNQRENCLALVFSRRNSGWDRNSFLLPYEFYDHFVALREAMKQPDKEHWTSCTVEVQNDGKYRYSFGYDRPRRLHRIHDDESMLKNYTPQQF